MKSFSKIEYAKILAVIIFSFYFINCIRNLESFHLISGVNLIIHEAGHSIFVFFGQFINILGGSLTQVLVPSVFAIYFFIRKDLFSGSIVLMWVGESIVEVSRYAKDAVIQELPLLGGDGVIHDWNWLLSTTGLLGHTEVIAQIIYSIGILIFIFGIVFAIYTAFYIKKDSNNP